jgi:aerobic carbon-monoxide dehydrogenase medium subunit
MYAFDFHRPSSVADVVTALKADDEAKALAGGQTLIPTLKHRLAKPTALIDLASIPELKAITATASGLRIGAMATHRAVLNSAEVKQVIPALSRMAGVIGDPAVRNRGTIGGSLANNDPTADYPAAVLALGATIVTDKRSIKADDWFQGMFTTALEPGEIIVAVEFPKPEKAGYEKFRNPASRYAMVGVFVAKGPAGLRVAVTGSGANGVFRATAMEQALAANWSPDAVAGVKVDPSLLMSDIHASAEYRAHLISVMAKRAVAAAS